MSLRARMFAQPPASAAPGQVVFQPPSQFVSLDQSWIVPAGVTSISYVLVSPDSNGTITLKKNGVTQSTVASQSRSGCDGGGNGGIGNSGGGGAGGYDNKGGDGGQYLDTPDQGNGGVGAGGGGGGGGGGHAGIHPNPAYSSERGGGVGLKGKGLSGEAGIGASFSSSATVGGDGSNAPGGGLFGAGSLTANGGGLGWKNALSVTAGDVIRIEAGVPSSGMNTAGARIIWGAGRSYPSAAGDV